MSNSKKKKKIRFFFIYFFAFYFDYFCSIATRFNEWAIESLNERERNACKRAYICMPLEY